MSKAKSKPYTRCDEGATIAAGPGSKPGSHYGPKISLVCLSPRKVPPHASGPDHARQVLLLQ